MEMVNYRPSPDTPMIRVPVGELAGGVMYVHEANTGVEYYVPADTLASADRPLWPVFNADVRQLVTPSWQEYYRHFARMSFEGYLHGFRSDAHPWKEMAIFHVAAGVYRRAVRRYRPDSRVKRQEIHRVLSTGMVARTVGDAASQVRGGWLNDRRVEEILTDYETGLKADDATKFTIIAYSAIVPDRSVPISMTREQAIAFLRSGGKVGRSDDPG